MNKDTALKLALEALEAGEYYIDDLEAIVYAVDDIHVHEDRAKMQEAITAIKQALAEPVQKPTVEDNSQYWAGMDGATAWHLIDRHADGWADVAKMMGEWLAANTPLYTTPPAAQQQWVELTDDEMQAIWDRYAHMEMMRAIEAKLKEKNT